MSQLRGITSFDLKLIQDNTCLLVCTIDSLGLVVVRCLFIFHICMLIKCTSSTDCVQQDTNYQGGTIATLTGLTFPQCLHECKTNPDCQKVQYTFTNPNEQWDNQQLTTLYPDQQFDL